MKMHRFLHAVRCLPLGAAFAIGACSQEVPPPPAPVAAAAPAASAPAVAPATAAAADTALPGAKLSVEVLSTDCSHDPVATVQVAWDVGALAVTGVAIHVESPGNASKLWVEGGATGKEATGPWVFANTRFSLRDKGDGRELASHTVATVSCPN